MLYRHICVCLALGIGIPTFANTDDSHQPAPLHQRIDAAIAESSLGSLAQIASDAEFLRRSYLDLHGRSPTVAEVNSFLAETEPNKRAVLVDKLLGADEFNDFFAIVLDVMFLERRGGSRISQEEWKTFLRNAISAKQPFPARPMIGNGTQRSSHTDLLLSEFFCCLPNRFLCVGRPGR